MVFGVGSLLRYEGLKQVGEGAYGHVYKARRKRTDAKSPNVVEEERKEEEKEQEVALKRLSFPPSKEKAGFPVFALREIMLLKRLRHPNVVHLLDIVSSKGCEDKEKEIKTESFRDRDSKQNLNNINHSTTGNEEKYKYELDIQRCGSIFLVFEYVEHDLSGLIDIQYQFDTQQCQYLALQLFRALDYLCEKNVMHRDIKSSNILITNKLELKVADFGMARQAQHLIDSTSILLSSPRKNPEITAEYTNNVVTMWYRPPELLLGETKYIWQALDTWSAGCVLAELELLRPLFPGKSAADQLGLIMDVLGPPTEANWSGVSSLPHYASLVKPRFSKENFQASRGRTLSLHDSYESKISEDMLHFIDRLLVLAPTKRLSPKMALSNKYLTSCPEGRIRPLELATSQHEFLTKRSLRLKRAAERNDCDDKRVKAR